MNMERAPSIEKPLSGIAKAGLIGSAAVIVLCFYLFALLSVLLILTLIACELLLAVALARFGMARVMGPVLNRHVALAGIFCRSFYSRKRAELNISIKREEAPGLFAMLDKLAGRLQLALPRVVLLEMTANAWVRLKGFRSGAGTTILGVGYDLLAGLSAAEAEAVLAHEMAHAKLIQRGVRNWLTIGLRHLSQLAGALHNEVNGCQRAKLPCTFAEGFLRMASWLAKLVASLVAAYSRQEEFAADRGAAEICGVAPMRSALIKTDALAAAAQRLPWRDRIAQLELGDGFSGWLTKELAAKQPAEAVQSSPELFDKYSTHPRLKDRLAALPPDDGRLQSDSKPALRLLAEPDAAAEKLMVEIQRVIAAEERQDSKRLKKLARLGRGSTRLQPLQLAGVCLAIIGGIGLIFGLATGFTTGLTTFILAAGGLAVLFHRVGRYRDRVELPVPDYAFLKQAWEKRKEASKPGVTEKDIESELRGRIGKQNGRAQRAQVLVTESYAALKRCDYLRAHVASRLCLDQDKKSVEGALGLAIASASLGQAQQVAWALASVRKITGLRGGSTAWGAAWALLLIGDWARAEALIDKVRKERPEEPTLLLLLAVCQSRRGKLQSAIISARQACTPAPRNKEHAKFFIGLLLHGGYLREAEEKLLKLEGQIRGDVELMFSMLRLNLLRRNLVAAEEWTRLLRQHSTSGITLVRLGEAYEAARKNGQAETYYYEALGTAFYPEARLGLARLEAHRQNKDESRQHLLAALDVSSTPGEESVGPLQLFHQIINLLVTLRDPIPNCRAWIARLNGNASPPALANVSFMVYAPGRSEAEKYLATILDAMRPGQPPLIPTIISWQEAPWQQRPEGLVRPGVQGIN
jgi:Zn-dependent protease with chaperone function